MSSDFRKNLLDSLRQRDTKEKESFFKLMKSRKTHTNFCFKDVLKAVKIF